MKKIFILTLSFLMLYGFAYSQEEGEAAANEQEETASVDTPKSGVIFGLFQSVDVSVLFGRDNFLTSGLSVPNPVSTNSSYGGNAPRIIGDLMTDGTSSAVTMMGARGRFNINSTHAITLSTGALISKTPAREYVQGYFPNPNVGNAGVIPNKLAVKGKTDFYFNAVIGYEMNFRKKNLSPYLGVGLPVYYGMKSEYDPTFKVNSNGTIYIADVGTRIATLFGIGAQITAGIDYYLRDNLYFGFEIKPYSFVYAISAQYPAPGIPEAQANTYAHGVFRQPLFKLGFVF